MQRQPSRSLKYHAGASQLQAAHSETVQRWRVIWRIGLKGGGASAEFASCALIHSRQRRTGRPGLTSGRSAPSATTGTPLTITCRNPDDARTRV